MNYPTRVIIILAIFCLQLSQQIWAQVFPVVISEVFYDTPLYEQASYNNINQVHHNGEFIELFNPTSSNIDISGWTITDRNTLFTIPTGTIIQARGMVIIAYRHPGSNFYLTDLFSSLILQGPVIYQNDIMLANDGETISLFDKNRMLVDNMSYRCSSTSGYLADFWNLFATNSDNKKNGYACRSLQRIDIHTSIDGVKPLIDDYRALPATPFVLPNGITLPFVNIETIETPIDETTVNIPYTFDKGLEVGTIPGKATISPTGAAMYQIPIEVPPGTNELQPKISIVYNSQGGYGALGYGWDISGTSAITRGTQNVYYDGVNGVVEETSIQFCGFDRFYLDGQRLILLKGELLKDKVYGTEVENYSRVKIVEGNNGNPFFTITSKDGQVLEYGATSNSLLKNADPSVSNDQRVMSWRLSKATDIHGNSIEYSYDGNYIDKIQYMGSNGSYENVVKFNYFTNTANDNSIANNSFRQKKIFIDGFLIKQNKILSSIVTTNSSNEVKKYTFDYIESPIKDARLGKITTYSSSGSKLNSTRINWGEEKTIQQIELGTMTDSKLNEEDNTSLFSGDIDGDGFKDKIEFHTGVDKICSNGYFRVIFKDKTINRVSFICEEGEECNYFVPQLVIADVNNDGKDEIILIKSDVMTSYYFESDNKFNSKTHKYYNDGNWWQRYSGFAYNAMLIDLNKDLYPDLLIMPYRKDVENSIEYVHANVFYGGKDGLSAGFGILTGPHYTNIQPQYGDFNADGKTEIIFLDYSEHHRTYVDRFQIAVSSIWGNDLFYKSGKKLHPRFEEIYSTDINNDGLTDLLIKQPDGYDNNWFAKINKGGEFVTPERMELNLVRYSRAKSDSERQRTFLIDFDGDGYQDLIIGDETFVKDVDWSWFNPKDYDFSYTTWYFYKNTGGNYVLEKTIKSNTRLSKMQPAVMDINNDGVADLVMGSGNKYVAFTKYNATKRNVVYSITDGMQQIHRFNYKNFSEFDQSAIDANTKIRNLKAPLMLVDYYVAPDGATTTYTYQKPQIHTEGKGFLGFKTVIAKNSLSNLVNTTNSEIDENYFNLKSQTTSIATVSGTAISSSSHTYENRNKDIEEGLNGQKRYITVLTSQTSADYLTGISKSGTYAYDDFGNVNTQTEVSGISTVETICSDFTKKTIGTSNIDYLPKTITVTNKRTNQPDITAVTKLTYNDKYLPETKTVNFGTYAETKTTYAYYPTGNIDNIKVEAKDCPAQTTTYSYDSKFRMATGISCTTGKSSAATYDYTNGNLLTKTNNKGHITKYEYTPHGHLYKEELPNGKTNYHIVAFETSGNYFYKETINSGLNVSETFYDSRGREVYQTTTGWKGKNLISAKYYNSINGLLQKSEKPHYADETVLYTTYLYSDPIFRPTEEELFDGLRSLKTVYDYSIANKTVVTLPDGQQKAKITDASGLVTGWTDAGGSISYVYNAVGQPVNITSNGAETTIEYDEAGRQKTLNDPNAGTINYRYYANGQLKKQTNAKGDETELWYDGAARLKTKKMTGYDGTVTETTYNYVGSGNGKGEIENIEQNVGGQTVHKQAFTYYPNSQLHTVTDTYDGQNVAFTYTYDSEWRPLSTTSPSGLVTTNHYNSFGHLDQVTAGSVLVWEGKEQNSNGQFTSYSHGNGIQTTRTYNQRGELEGILANKPGVSDYIQNNTYSYFPTTQSLNTRKDLKNGRSEECKYDAADRLTEAWMNGQLQYSMSYKSNGNIDTKSDVGTYKYETPRPHAMSGVDNVSIGVGNEKQFIDYTLFNKVSRIEQGLTESTITKVYDIFYGLDEQRIKTVYDDFTESNKNRVRYYFGTYEKDSDTDGNITNTDYIYSPVGLIAIHKNNVLYFVHTDLLGSVERITNASGAMISEYSYTPWGGRILLSGVNITDRGYTGHEHLSPFGDDTNSGFSLINMNGRIYDPVLARFLSPDPYVQAPDFTQSFNRYSYGCNNPFKYTDPSGEFAWVAVGIIVGFLYLKAAHDYAPKENQGNPLKWAWNPVDWFKPSASNPNGGVPYFEIGGGANTDGSGAHGYFSFGNPNQPMPAIGYHADYGWGGGYNQYGKTSMYYPNYNYSAPEQAVVRAEHEARKIYINQSYKEFSNMSNYFDIMSVGFEANQMSLRPYMSYMDDFTKFGKFTQSLGGASNAFGRMATATGVVGLGFEYQSMKQGDVSMSRFGYHIASFGASVGVGAAYGNLPGAAAGGAFWAGETIYDNIVVPGMNIVWQLEMGLRTMHERMLYW